MPRIAQGNNRVPTKPTSRKQANPPAHSDSSKVAELQERLTRTEARLRESESAKIELRRVNGGLQGTVDGMQATLDLLTQEVDAHREEAARTAINVRASPEYQALSQELADARQTILAQADQLSELPVLQSTIAVLQETVRVTETLRIRELTEACHFVACEPELDLQPDQNIDQMIRSYAISSVTNSASGLDLRPSVAATECSCSYSIRSRRIGATGPCPRCHTEAARSHTAMEALMIQKLVNVVSGQLETIISQANQQWSTWTIRCALQGNVVAQITRAYLANLANAAV